MSIIRYLMQDHRAIERMLAIISSMCTQLKRGKAVDAEHMHAAVEWIREFVGGWHLAKEENILFPPLADAGMPREGGPIGVMLDEHQRERDLVRGMTKAAADARSGREGAKQAFCEHAGEYIALISAHIQKEDQVLYPMADKLLDDAKQDELWIACLELEEKMGRAWRDEMSETLQELSVLYSK